MTDKKTVGPTTKAKNKKIIPCDHYKDSAACPECSNPKPAVSETPAIDVEKGAVNQAIDAITFNPTMFLPELTKFAGGDNEIGPIADVLFASGYFDDLTPAQIAVHILAGRSLGLDDAQAVFDLEIGPGPTIRYKDRQTYQETGDAIEAQRAGYKGPPLITPKPASRAHNAETGVAAGSNVAEFPNSANKGPSPIPEPGNGEDSGSIPETTGAAGLSASAAAIGDDPFTEPAQEPDLLLPVPGSIGDPARAAEAAQAAESIGDISPETINVWREGLESICNELSIPTAERLTKFDGEGISGKKKMFDDAQVYYSTKTGDVRDEVLTALAADGKTTIEAMQGFFAFAGVGSDPAAWAYPEAVKALISLSDFLRPPAA